MPTVENERDSIVQEIERLKNEKNAVILAHYYVCDEVQAIADYIGDSYYLAKVAVGLKESTIVFAGVRFMGESAKILNPEKTVLMPDINADCPMAHMADVEKIEEVRKNYEDVAVVCYINSTAELKMHSDVCVTSANAMKIVEKLPNKNIYFIPDENLGRYIAEKLPEKHFIFNDGFCHVHKAVTADMVKRAKESHPEAEVLIHPECTLEVLAEADYIGSTSGIIEYATKSDAKEFIISTELGVLYQLKKNNPTKKFYAAGPTQICPNMKKVTLEKVRDCLRDNTGVIEVGSEKRIKSLEPLSRMLQLAQ
ncbi:MAG: quinolinate synthase NadA [Pseudobutyrivibrio sp.]|nr:quinolinate synthase NadA [Pseudobutyrivibrio sp.]